MYYVYRKQVSNLDGKLSQATDTLKRLQEEQGGLGKAMNDNQLFLEQLSTDLDRMIDSSHNFSLQDPYGRLTVRFIGELFVDI